MNKPDKGKYGGSCNVTACQAPFAFSVHRHNFGAHYCLSCALKINEANMHFDGSPIITIPVDIDTLIENAL